jgi:NADP-dependent aldehyde dehydrogenase
MTDSTTHEVDAAARSAARAFAALRDVSDAERSSWLEVIADALDTHTDELVTIADEETALGRPRLTGEVARTTGQLRMFATVVREGSYLEAVIDHAVPEATPPRPDLRRFLVPLGPVAVFSASNFPFAFSVAGGDTASALAAGCPVIVKAHSGHRRLSERTAQIVSSALRGAGAPEGLFALVQGRDAGLALVDHPTITAVGFTGSVAGGRALFDRAMARPDPIPFFGELGSINPVVVTRAADSARGDALAAGLAGSFQLGAGQFCTKPGLVFVPRGSRLEGAIASHVGDAASRLLTPSIADGFIGGLGAAVSTPGVDVVAGTSDSSPDAVRAAVLATDTESLVASADTLLDEVFGPVTLLVRYDDEAELPGILSRLEGSLTATVHAEPEDDIRDVLYVLEQRAGRILFAGWPTGVAVTWSQHHGGPWPATTSQHTSVGATAIRRFQRPLAFQDAPDALLPAPLREFNPWGVPRRVDGILKHNTA